MAILKMKGYASLWYKDLKKNGARDAEFKIKTWSNLKKQINKRFLLSSYR